MKIKTNHHYRPLLYWHDLTDAEKAEYRDAYDDVQDSTFFRYRNWVYDMSDFLRVNNDEKNHVVRHGLYGWDGYKNDSFFSSVVVKYNDDCDAVKVGLVLFPILQDQKQRIL